jgi:sugar phosphate isomerase/epimerase
MILSAATANYYHRPFEQALEIIARSGLQYIELDLFWERKQWAMAQHLRGCAPRDVVRWVRQAGLTVASIHDGGGVLDEPGSVRGFVNPQLAEYLDHLGYAPDCLVFHTPHIEGNLDGVWWQGLKSRIIEALEPYRGACGSITIENMPSFDGYTVPILTPEALLAFVREAGVSVTLDTTHYAQMGTDIVQAARTLYGKVHTIHLSDYVDGKTHVFPGDGMLNFADFFAALDFSALRAVTLECSPARLGENSMQLDTSTLSERLSAARACVEGWLAEDLRERSRP